MQFTATALTLLLSLANALPSPTTGGMATGTATATGPTYNPSNPPKLRSGGFVSSCSGQHLTYDDGWYLVAECDNYRGNDVATSLHLGTCFGNDVGQIVYEKNGAFGDSCSEVYLAQGHYLGGQCATGRGSTREATSINLNSYVGNIGGRLSC